MPRLGSVSGSCCNFPPASVSNNPSFQVPPVGPPTPGKDVYDPQGLPSKGHFTENWPSFGSTGYFRGKLAPFLGLSGILSGGAPPSNIQHDTPPSTIGGRQQQLSKHRKSAKLP